VRFRAPSGKETRVSFALLTETISLGSQHRSYMESDIPPKAACSAKSGEVVFSGACNWE
jgi:hypothetical protein